ncbi:initiation factor 2 [Nemania sp. FL0031]|nr:initiation factor 2 [Nemania sp. FL0031]
MLRGRLAKRDNSSLSFSTSSVCAFCQYRLSLRRPPGPPPPQRRLFSVTTQCASDYDASRSRLGPPFPTFGVGGGSGSGASSTPTPTPTSPQSPARPTTPGFVNFPFVRQPLDDIIDPHEVRARQRLLAQQQEAARKAEAEAIKAKEREKQAREQREHQAREREQRALASRQPRQWGVEHRRHGDTSQLRQPPSARPPFSRAGGGIGSDSSSRSGYDTKSLPDLPDRSSLVNPFASFRRQPSRGSAIPWPDVPRTEPPASPDPLARRPSAVPWPGVPRAESPAAPGSGFDALEEAGVRDAELKATANNGVASFGASEEWGRLTRKPTHRRDPKDDNWGIMQNDVFGSRVGATEQPDPQAMAKPKPALENLTGSEPPKAEHVSQPTSRGWDDRYDSDRNKRWELSDQEKTSDKRRGGGGGKRSRRTSRFEEDDDDDGGDDAYERYQERRRQKELRKAQREADRTEPIPIILPELIGITAFANALKIKPEDFLVQLGELGFEGVTLDSLMAGETAALVAQEYGYEPTVEVGDSQDLKPRPPPEDPSILPSRPPVVTIMGHVDHGKTTILDYLRKSSVVAQEHGGITQHIGAFSVRLSSGKPITFLDTPGHAAFLTMRQRGAHVTDIVVLVVAADDSVKPQTLEALKHARAAKVPIIVAINKVDKEGANIDAVKHDLAHADVEIEDFGGDVQVVCVSGKTGQGMDDLEENILTLSEILDHRAEPDGPAEGWILESSLKPTGKVATVLVKRGTLRPGDYIAAGLTWAKIRQLRNEAGAEIEEAPPGTPVEILGWKDLPAAGDQVIQSPDEDLAKRAVSYREGLHEREKDAAEYETITEERRALQEKRAREKALDEEETGGKSKGKGKGTGTGGMGGTGVQEVLPDEEDGTKLINFVVKGDVHGSVEAVCAAIQEIGSHEVRPRILRSATGAIGEFDVEHAAMSKSVIVNFAMAVPGHIQQMAEMQGVRILDHTVIYHLIDEVKANLSAYLAPDVTTRVLGDAEVLQIFPINLRGRVYKNIAGCRVRNGVVAKNHLYRVLRRGEVIFDGKLETLKHIKKDVMEMRKGTECGMGFVDFQDLEVGDQIQAYEEVRTARTLA